MFMPFNVLAIWLRGLFALALFGSGIALLALWYANREIVVTERVPVEVTRAQALEAERDVGAQRRPVAQEEIRERVVHWQFGLNRETAFLFGGLVLLAWSLGAGGLAGSPRLLRRPGSDEPKAANSDNAQRLHLPDGSALRVQSFGAADGSPVVLIHGWGLDSDEWYYAKKELGGRYRLIVWDLPGLGQSERPADRDWSLDRLARDLDRVIDSVGGKPVTLIGHSIGVMVILTYCKLFPASLGGRVRALVLAHGTYTNPVRTTAKSGLYTALQKPLLEPLCHAMVWFSPLVRVLNWLSYINGSAHRSTERDSFSGKETRGQLDFLTRYYCKAAPDVVGRGMLGMLRYDATDTLHHISVPTLVVTGDQDRTCLPEASRYIADSIPGATLVTLKQAKHCGHFEHHDAFHASVLAFLDAGAALETRDGRADKAIAAGGQPLRQN